LVGTARTGGRIPRRWAAFDACLDGLAKLYHTNQIQTLFFVMTILTLVGNSIRHAYLRPRADFGVDVTLTAFLGLFAIEIALLSLKEPGYWGSVFMAFDVLGAASIVLDVPWLQGGRGSPLMESSSARGTTRTARAVRLIRFMRFVRLVRMAKLMKFLDCFSDAKEEDASEAAQVDAGGSAPGQHKRADIPNFKGSYLGRFPLVSADFWTSDHLSERSRSVDAFFGTRVRETLTLKRR